MSIKREITQVILNRVPPLKRVVHRVYSSYTNWRGNRGFHERIKIVKKDFPVEVEGNPTRNVVVIAVDCMRYLNTSLSGYIRDTTPFLKHFGVAYRSISAAPWTYPSVPSILAGLYPHNHGAYIKGTEKYLDNLKNLKGIKPTVITLPEIMYILGYGVYMATAIELSSLHFRRRVPLIRWYPGETRAEKIFKDFVEWVNKQKGRPFFAYLHLGDPHEPLNPPDEYWNYFGSVERLKGISTWNYTKPDEWNKDDFWRYRDNRILLYDNVLRYVNDQIESFMGKLEALGILKDTIVVITADHGEEFWEHAAVEAEYFFDTREGTGYGHGHNVFREIVEVPLVIYGIPKLKDREFASSVDIVPTILNELGITVNFKMDGVPLQDKEPKGRVTLTEAAGYGYEKKALYWGDFKFLYAPMDNVKWVFNLKRDPKEQRPIKDPQITTIFEQKLKKMLSRSVTIRQLGQ